LSVRRPEKLGVEPLLYEDRVHAGLRVIALPKGGYAFGEPSAVTNIGAVSEGNYYIDRWRLTWRRHARTSRTAIALRCRH